MAMLKIVMLLALAAHAAPEPVEERAEDVVRLLLAGTPAEAFVAVGDDEYRNQVVVEVRDRLVAAFATRDEATDERLASTFAVLVDQGFGGPLEGQAQGEVLMWAEALWEAYIGDLDDGYRVDHMLGAVLRGLGRLPLGARDEWARRLLGRVGIRDLPDAAFGLRPAARVPAWFAAPNLRIGGFLFGVMDAWVGRAETPGSRETLAGKLSTLTTLLDSRLLLDRLLAVQGLKCIETPAATVALMGAGKDAATLYMYLDGHTVGSQAGLALVAGALNREMESLHLDLVAAKMDVTKLEHLRRDILTDLEGSEASFTAKYSAAVAEMQQAWGEIQRSSASVRRRWLGLLRGACRREVDAAPEVGLLAGDAAWRGRVADTCLARVSKDAEVDSGTGPVFRREDALAAVGLALKARDRDVAERVMARGRAYLRTVAEAAYDTPRGREEIDELTAWTMDDPATAAVVRRIVDLAFERALADGRAEGPVRDGAPGLLEVELDEFVESGKPEARVLALLVGLRWHLLWRDAGSDGRSILKETAWVRFDTAYWERAQDLRARIRTEPYAREILEDLARDDEDVASLRWGLPSEDRPFLERIRKDLQRAGNAAAKAATRTSGVPDVALAVFLAHYPALEEVAGIWLIACAGERPKTPAPARLTPPKPPENPLDLRRSGPPPSAYTDVVHASFGKIRDCYDERVKRRPKLRGTLTVEVEISTLGEVEARIADDGLGDEQVAKCVLRTVRRLDFPTPGDKVHVFRVPFYFEP